MESHDKDFTGVVKDPGIEVTQPRASLKGTLGDTDSPWGLQIRCPRGGKSTKHCLLGENSPTDTLTSSYLPHSGLSCKQRQQHSGLIAPEAHGSIPARSEGRVHLPSPEGPLRMRPCPSLPGLQQIPAQVTQEPLRQRSPYSGKARHPKPVTRISRCFPGNWPAVPAAMWIWNLDECRGWYYLHWCLEKRGKNVYPKKSMKGNRMRERTSSISKPENVTALSLINGVMLDGQPNWRKTQQRPYINIKCLQIEKWTKVWNPNVHFLCLFYKERLLRYSLKLRCCKQISRRNL